MADLDKQVKYNRRFLSYSLTVEGMVVMDELLRSLDTQLLVRESEIRMKESNMTRSKLSVIDEISLAWGDGVIVVWVAGLIIRRQDPKLPHLSTLLKRKCKRAVTVFTELKNFEKPSRCRRIITQVYFV
jgi:hypothetical protein